MVNPMALSCCTQSLVFSRFLNCCRLGLGTPKSSCSIIQLNKGYSSTSSSSRVTNLPPISSSSASLETLAQTTLLNYTQRQQHTESLGTHSCSNGRVMLIDGTSVIYRAYYKLLGMSVSSLIICNPVSFT